MYLLTIFKNNSVQNYAKVVKYKNEFKKIPFKKYELPKDIFIRFYKLCDYKACTAHISLHENNKNK